jgi:hypothetical protein
MSESTAIAAIVILDVALIGFLAWMMSHPRHLRPHVPANDPATPTSVEQRPRFARGVERAYEATTTPSLDLTDA